MMRYVTILLLAVICLMAFVESVQSKVYLNRRLISCDPLIYVVEPIELYGKVLSLDRNTQNDYGQCVGDAPGPPFIIEQYINIFNEYNNDGSVLHWGSFIIDNAFQGGDPFEIEFNPGSHIFVNGSFTATGKPGDKVIFTGETNIYSNYTGGPSNIPLQEFTFNFSHCEFRGNESPSYATETLEMRGGHLILDNCWFHATNGQQALYYHGENSENGWNVKITNSFFSHITHPTSSPVSITGISTIDLHNILFQNCEYPLNGGSNALMAIVTDTLLGISGFSGSSNSANLIRFGNMNHIRIKNSVSIQTTNNFPVLFPSASSLIVDNNATLTFEKGSVIQVGDNPTGLFIDNYGKVILDSTVITSYRDNSYGVQYPGLSSDVPPSQSNVWGGIDVQPGGKLELKNNSRLRWASGAIESQGEVKVDNSIIEQCWGAGVEVFAESPTKLEVNNSTIKQIYGTAAGIDYRISLSTTDSASGRLIVDSCQITQCGGDGVYVAGGIGRPLEDSINVRISNCLISGNGGSGVFGSMGQPADSIIVTNTRLIGNGGRGLWLIDYGCDSMDVLLENNVALANGDDGLKVETGFVDAIGNTCAFNVGMGLMYPQKPRHLGKVANNIFSYNDEYGFYCYAKYGGIVPEIANNIFWQNDAENELQINSDETGLIYTVAELQALGGVGTTNDEFSPAFKPDYKDVVRFRSFIEAQYMSWIWVNGDSLEAGQLEGLAIMPSHRDTTAWFYVIGNSCDTIYVAGDITSVTNALDTLTVVDYHLMPFSQAIDFGNNDYVSTQNDIDGEIRIIDSDEDGSEIVDAGADEYDPDPIVNVSITVLNPPADTTLIPGSTLMLLWLTQGINSVNVDYTTDVPLGGEPMEWLPIAQGLSPALPLYPWEIPAVMSARCLIRISDADNPEYSNTSEIFHIKPYYLTRYAADSTYEFFKPSVHGWSLRNDLSTMWPQSWWQQYDYLSGMDPYTGREYPSFDIAYPFGYIEPSIFPSWPIMVESFGQDQCYTNTPTSLLYVMRAVNRWVDIAETWGGSCSGLCSSSLLAFGSLSDLQTRWEYLGLSDNLYQHTITSDIREFINVIHTNQQGEQQLAWLDQHFASTSTVDGTVKQIREILLSNTRNNDALLIIGDQAATMLHGVVPWAIVSDPDPDRIRISIYDPAYPGNDALYILVDTVTNVWSYSNLPTWGGPKQLFLFHPVRWCLDAPELQALEKQHSTVATAVDSVAGLELLYPSDGYLSVRNNNGDSSGFNTEGVFNHIEGATPIIPIYGQNDSPNGFLLPDQEYEIRLSKLVDSTVRIGLYLDSLYIGYSRMGTDSSYADHLRINHDVTVHNPDTTLKTVQLRMVQTLPEKERALVVSGFSVNQDDSVSLSPIDSSGWYLSNLGEAKYYGLWLREISTDGEKKFYSANVLIGASHSHIFTPDWAALNKDSCTVYVDTDLDGVADSSIVLRGDILVGVNDDPDQILPYRFELSQNYPNPFNPVTTIKYSLPQRSHVTIEVFNVLGQKVRSLVGREESAGFYTVTWDGTDKGGKSVATGVYLYRFQAGDHIETKKMVLLK